ncbi:Developmental and secondary metabolism regulator veA [Exophiala dermatitidis]
MGVSESQSSISTVQPDPDNHASLPALREIVGAEITQRPLLPQPPVPAFIPEFFIPGISTVYIDEVPIRTYVVGGLHYAMAQPPNETKSEHSRVTIDGRCITYKLEVVQQPEKARACGSGPRSSADRRPVDPPPVVELRVFCNDTDIMMLYDATFMLYASLEVARPIAGGKMHTPPVIPVLTGVAVASAAYLDRPKKAAYFIFPDLSVRHEGWYRLKFSLFEGIKHEMDADQGMPFVHNSPAADKLTPPVRHESMANRLEVQSVPFQVYSAKKFPGLNTSTYLSKLVAEQGCRVRIRRDIRQRKRPQKEPEVEDAHSSYHGTPQAAYRSMEHPQHSRSASRNSLGSQFDAELARRASIESLYNRPAIPSRHSSIAPLPSPSLPSLPPTNSLPSLPPSLPPTNAMPPPPTHSHPSSLRQMLNPPAAAEPSMPPPKAYQPFTPTSAQPSPMRPITPDNEDSLASLTLPPILNTSLFNQTTRQYDLPDPTASKRSYSSHTTESEFSLKLGARPDIIPASQYPRTPAPGANDYIEPDNSVRAAREAQQAARDRELFGEPLVYSRSNGNQVEVRHPYLRHLMRHRAT